MARIPSFEEVLLEVHQSLGLERPQSKYINQFRDLDMPLSRHVGMGEELLASVMAALDLDAVACRDMIANVQEWGDFHKALELHVWTGPASQRQVLWHLLAYSYIPSLARRVAFWSLAGVEHQQPFDAGMPGGEFWFCPNGNPEHKRIDLPVQQVTDWLIDILGGQSLEEATHGFARKESGKDLNGHALRRLQGWRLEGRLPKSAKEIDELFDDEAELEFLGAFECEEGVSTAAQFQAAMRFVGHKGLDATALRDQIPMTIERLAAILGGSSPEDDQQEFVRLVSLRYSKPTMRIIRQRLKVARMVQDGYQRLLKFLCPGVAPTCADPTQNKLLQLIGLFQTIYNLTIEAWKNGSDPSEEDAYFEARLAPWDRADLLLSILPSLQGRSVHSKLAERLTRKFLVLEPDSPLEDLVALGEAGAQSVILARVEALHREAAEDARQAALLDRVRVASPWRALQGEDSYWIVSQLVQNEDLPKKVRAMAAQRLHKMAKPPGQAVGAVVLELDFLLNGPPTQRPTGVCQSVQRLLDSVPEGADGYEEWKAPLLRFRAKHLLMQNQFADACDVFQQALRACLERGYGDLAGQIARDGFAVEIAEFGFRPKGQERYYRNMMAYGMFPAGVPSFEDATVACEEYFWGDLYHPYPGVERETPPAVREFEPIFKETFGLIAKADWDGLQCWMQRHAKTFRKANTKDARRNSVLLMWLKMLHKVESTVVMFATHESASALGQIFTHLNHWRDAIRLLVEVWPEQARIADFKGQTALMFVAAAGDVALTTLLAPISDVDAQDYLGRTALHAAAGGRSLECVAAVLERNPDVGRVTGGGGNSALHTAVQFAAPGCARIILEEFPGLALMRNMMGQTPLAMVRAIVDDLPSWRKAMGKDGRGTGSDEDVAALVALLESP
ncbi:ankyrin repeat domain-containing protein [Ralstonia sp. A12]|uniref:ankyrin repeat domain-containing protein n=1 Tax=Ralstonia sp. A12 TaxID=1217052 RepID=UPI000693D7AE|nr:ankyrin repeat domain-containing protein [Ralstonia sp. A12]